MKLNILLVMSLLLFLGEEGSVMSIPDEEVHQLYRIVNKFALVSYKVRGNIIIIVSDHDVVRGRFTKKLLCRPLTCSGECGRCFKLPTQPLTSTT